MHEAFTMRHLAFAIVGLLGALGANARAEPEPPAIVVRLSQPDVQARRVIALFRDAKVPHPAAALAAWKNATGESLGKPIEALLAAFNPGMIRELRSLDDAELTLRFDSAPHWRLLVPRDDGSLAAFLPALSLTDGKIEPSIGANTILQLGPPGAPVGALGAGGLLVASDAAQLEAGLAARANPRPVASLSGWEMQLDPSAFRDLSRIEARRLSALLDSLGCDRATCQIGMDKHDTFAVRLTTHLDAPAPPLPAIDPAWLDAIPASGVVGAFAMALDSRGRSLDAIFATLDRVEKADPDRAAVAPLRTRLNLLTAAAKVFPDVDLWPHLRGVVGAILTGEPGTLSALLVLRTDTPESAEWIAARVVPRLASAFYPNRPLDIKAVGPAVFVGTGVGSLASALDAAAHPDRSSSATIRADWGSTAPHRFGALWPARVPGLDVRLARTLNAAPPALWSGRARGEMLEDEIHWKGLDQVVKNGLEGLPLKVPKGPSERDPG